MSTVVQTKPPLPADADDRDAPLVSVVIPCLNEAENIEVCVAAALGALRDGAISGEVLVVDNASEDDSAAVAASLVMVGIQIFFSSFLLSILGLRRR
jgi:cellulose synthase/poly-beta-1,6-N-acetylglucosamine synthase-like glycosyltransferase